ncbi:Prestin [Aphelenchoides fujianensis]|nr:Prestin [Aphelenchoides fujianensis]
MKRGPNAPAAPPPKPPAAPRKPPTAAPKGPSRKEEKPKAAAKGGSVTATASTKEFTVREPEIPLEQRPVVKLDALMKEDKTQSLQPVPDPGPEHTRPPGQSLKEFTAKDAEQAPSEMTARSVHEGLRQRTVANQEHFDKKYGFTRQNLSLMRRMLRYFADVKNWKGAEWLFFFRSRVPITKWLLEYSWRTDLLPDVIAGLMMSIIAIPQGLAYGFLVGLPPVHGLYTTIVGPVVYALLGTSRHVSSGPFSIVALMVSAAVSEVTEEIKADRGHGTSGNELEAAGFCCWTEKPLLDHAEVLEIVGCLTLMTGCIQLLLGLMNAGILAVWLSDQLVQGLTSGAAVLVLTSQLPYMTGIKHLPSPMEFCGIPKASSRVGTNLIDPSLVQFYICFFKNIGQLQPNPTVLSVVCCVLLLFSKQFLDKVLRKWTKIKFPMELVIVVLSILINYFAASTHFDLDLHNVGAVESGMKRPAAPRLRYASKLFVWAITTSVVAFAVHIALVKLIAKKLNYQINANQEWLALGGMNFVAAFFGCFVGASSLSRSFAMVKLGAKTQMSTLVSVCVLLAVVYGAAEYFYYLPLPVLACIVVIALKDLLVQIVTSAQTIKVSFIDFLIWYVTFMAVVFVSFNIGLIVGVSFALLTVVFRSQWAESTCMGRILGTTDFKGVDHYRAAVEVPGIRVFRFDAPLYFANAELFLSRLHNASGIDPVLVVGKLEDVKQKRKADAPTAGGDGEKTAPKASGTKGGEPTTAKEKDIQLHVLPVAGNPSKEIVEGAVERTVDLPTLKQPQREAEELIQLTHIVIDCSSFPYIDLMGLQVLEQAYLDYQKIGIQVYLSTCKGDVRQFFERADFYKRVPKVNMFVSVIDAVTKALLDRDLLLEKAEKERLEAEERGRLELPPESPAVPENAAVPPPTSSGGTTQQPPTVAAAAPAPAAAVPSAPNAPVAPAGQPAPQTAAPTVVPPAPPVVPTVPQLPPAAEKK